ncbi:hypothetical protein [Stenotrophomonas sp.]|uniref:hypothetical protein n=1 Tax=Stenotrophomonas sp. TaxID=69392 RepID=UPI00333E7AAB
MSSEPMSFRAAIDAVWGESYEARPVQDIEELPQDAAESISALMLGSAQLLKPTSHQIIQEFKNDEDLEWPAFKDDDAQQLDDWDSRAADHIAKKIVNLSSIESRERLHLLAEVSGALFGDHPMERSLLRFGWTRVPEAAYSQFRDSRTAAISIMFAGMSSRDPLIRISAAVSTLIVSASVLRVGQAFRILSREISKPWSALTMELAQVGLLRLGLGTPAVAQLLHAPLAVTPFPSPPLPSNPSRAAILVHGTVFGRHGSTLDKWWQPGSGDLHQYLKTGSLPNLYGKHDFYEWSGGWNDHARNEGAKQLAQWLSSRSMSDADIIAHSHGGNVAMLASAHVTMNRLTLLSCPVWEDYRPVNVASVHSIRINWDLVILADGGAQRFPKKIGIQETVLPIWFTSHGCTHRSSTWKEMSLDAEL